jgi:uncharacterized protein (DUF488 family)
MTLAHPEGKREIRTTREPAARAALEVPCLFTLGYEGSTIDQFVRTARANGIRAVVDVRKNPISRKRGFAKSAFRAVLEQAGIAYFHLPELGVPSERRQNIKTPEAYRALFEYYDREVLSTHSAAVDRILGLLSEYTRVALVCFEADHSKCHRHRITENISQEHAKEIRIKHLTI